MTSLKYQVGQKVALINGFGHLFEGPYTITGTQTDSKGNKYYLTKVEPDWYPYPESRVITLEEAEELKNYKPIKLDDNHYRVIITSNLDHIGYNPVIVTLEWSCPHCGQRRGEPTIGLYESEERSFAISEWENPCGHSEKLINIINESHQNGFN